MVNIDLLYARYNLTVKKNKHEVTVRAKYKNSERATVVTVNTATE